MKSIFRSKYRLILEDESRLERIGSRRFSAAGLTLIGLALLAVALVPCVCLVLFTPLRSLLPGYLKESQREQTIDNMMRIDSLYDAYSRNESYLRNILTVMDTDRVPSDSSARVTAVNRLTPDSLSGPSAAERKFNAIMSEREKYNISVIAPLAAEGMTFSPLSSESTVTTESRNSIMAVVLMARDTPVGSIADGRVIAVGNSPSEGAWIVIAHAKGFISRTARLGRIFAEPGDYVAGSQIVALPATTSGRDQSRVTLEMWHNGDQLKPWKYIGAQPDETPAPVIDEDVGRGRL